MCFMARLHPIAAAVGLHHCPLIFTRKQDPLMLQQRTGLAKSDGGFHLKNHRTVDFLYMILPDMVNLQKSMETHHV